MFAELKNKLTIGAKFKSIDPVFKSIDSVWTVTQIATEFVKAESTVDSKSRRGKAECLNMFILFTGEHMVADIIEYFMTMYGVDESDICFTWEDEIGEVKECRFFDGVKEDNSTLVENTLTYNDGKSIVEFIDDIH